MNEANTRSAGEIEGKKETPAPVCYKNKGRLFRGVRNQYRVLWESVQA